MKNFIKELLIVNFKSIKYLKLTDFRRINLFIGSPNVGKSNILESISLFSIPFLVESPIKKHNNLIRLEEPNQIFTDGIFLGNNYVRIERENKFIDSCHFILDKRNGNLDFEIVFDNLLKDNSKVYDIKFFFDNQLNCNSWTGSKPKDFISYIKRYTFNDNISTNEIKKRPFLLPPFGTNLEYVIELFFELKEVYSQWFNKYGLRLVLDRGSNSIKVLKDSGKEVFILPYTSIADTLRRLIFYKTAVVSNVNSVLIFEEPEAHSFPPYIAQFTQEVIHSETNQFIMATHSPIIVNDFLENAREDLAIFMVDFKDGQTVARPLSREEIEEVYVNGVDLFFNNEAYTA